MTKLRILPHREISVDAIQWGSWWVRINGKRLPVEKRIDGWDYATRLVLELQPSIDPKLVLESTGLASLTDIDLVLLCECTSTGRRFMASSRLDRLMSDPSNIVILEPPPDEIAKSVKLSAHLVLNRTIPDSTDPDTAQRRGSRLAHFPSQTVWLEGESPRFPTAAVPFSDLSMEGALWDLSISFNDLDEPFASGVRLLINTEHPSAEILLDAERPDWPLAQSALKVDIARQLFIHVSQEESLNRRLDPPSWPEGSVGASLASMAEVFLGSDLASSIEMVRADTRRFERRLQERLDLFRSHP